MTKPRARFAVVTVAAVIGSLGAPVGAASASDPSAPAPTSISIRVAHPRIEPNTTGTVLGNVNIRGVVKEAGRPVTLEAKARGESEFAPIGTDTTGRRGKLRLDVTPSVTTRYRWHYAGATDARPSRSGVATIKVGTKPDHPRRLATSLSIRAPHRLVDADGTATILGRLRSRHFGVPHRRVVLLSRTADQPGWYVAGKQLTDRNGKVRFEAGQEVRTAYRLKFWGDRVFRPSRSGVVRIGVRPLVSISASPDRIDPGGSTAVTGVVTFEGEPLVGAAVELRSRRAHSSHRFAVVGTGTTGPDGSVTISDSPTRDTVYRLVVLRTADVPRGVSPAVKVVVRFPTSLSIRGRDTADGFVVSGTLRGHGSALRGALVSLLSLAPGGTTWTEVDASRTGKHGKVRFVVPSSEGTSYQLSFAGNRRYASSSSGVVVD